MEIINKLKSTETYSSEYALLNLRSNEFSIRKEHYINDNPDFINLKNVQYKNY